MNQEMVDTMLSEHRVTEAKLKCLTATLDVLDNLLEIAKSEMVDDEVSLSQQLTGMPHGSGTTDPTGRLAIEIASGHVSWRVDQIEDEIRNVKIEISKIEWKVIMVNAWLGCLNERERFLIEKKYLDEMTWKEIEESYNKEYGVIMTKRGLKNIIDRGIEKIYCAAE